MAIRLKPPPQQRQDGAELRQRRRAARPVAPGGRCSGRGLQYRARLRTTAGRGEVARTHCTKGRCTTRRRTSPCATCAPCVCHCRPAPTPSLFVCQVPVPAVAALSAGSQRPLRVRRSLRNLGSGPLQEVSNHASVKPSGELRTRIHIVQVDGAALHLKDAHEGRSRYAITVPGANNRAGKDAPADGSVGRAETHPQRACRGAQIDRDRKPEEFRESQRGSGTPGHEGSFRQTVRFVRPWVRLGVRCPVVRACVHRRVALTIAPSPRRWATAPRRSPSR